MLLGNTHFRKGEYRMAIAEYEAAIDILPTAAYLSNMAAAWLKLEVYDSAEECAQNALCLDPRFTRARYRRGLVRKGNLQLAAADVDFTTVLEQDPDSTEARKALDETFALISERDNEDESVADDDVGPSLTNPGKELESVSDSSDWNHWGNGFPCRYYNRDGCTRGVVIASGATFVYFLLGDCRSGGCTYSHDKTYLPSGRWWDEQKRGGIRFISKGLIRKQNPAFLHRLFANIDGRVAWAHPAEKENKATFWSDNMEMLQILVTKWMTIGWRRSTSPGG
ncbi:hypothetical protein EDB92DRAFT_192891 [Lactarius akahatsu]|uniref:TPR-like protein n=1 Tax=Lactarius akahatsu TaxID=416441 RepID=A0AAD4L891_9AGAM|nr:hypothetical protein EDB92DRAFT_192891 [Lactarius akahatsu]